MGDNRNLILAFALSFLVLIAWQYFVAQPQIEREQARQEAQQQAEDDALTPQPSGSEVAGSSALDSPGRDAGRQPRDRTEALAQSPRIPIDTPSVSGSIALKGARIDDLRLKGYRRTIDPDSPTIVLLSPQDAPSPYFAQFGWQPAANSDIATPGSDAMWEVVEGDTLTPSQPVTLRWDNGEGQIFRRTIGIDEDFIFTIRQTVENTAERPVTLYPYGLVRRISMPETIGFFILHEGLIGVLEDSLTEIDYDDIMDEGARRVESTGGWLGITDKYWLTALLPQQDVPITAEYKFAGTEQRPIFQTNYLRPAVQIGPGETAEITDHFFAGAKVTSVLERYEEELGVNKFHMAIDWGWFFFLTKPFFHVLHWLYELVGNFGVAILIFTVLVKLVFFPLANKSYVAMSKMKKLQPEMMKIRERYADDRMKQQQAMMELYQTEKVNPLSGCLPIVIQIPVFFALYKVLFVTIEMRHAPFFGWIKDLSAPDPTTIFNLFGLIPWDPPSFLMIGVWPCLMGLTMFVQQKLNPPPADPTQAKVFLFLPIIFTFILAPFAAGLVIYWTWNNLLSVIQQAVIMKRMGVPIEFYVGSKAKTERS